MINFAVIRQGGPKIALGSRHVEKKKIEVSAYFKKFNFWLRRKSHLPLVVIGSLVVILLFMNDETSLALNMKYEKEINRLSLEIKENRDSAAFYRSQRESIIYGTEDLEHMARERFHMQKPSEDVYILK